jgi:indole-3-glycerol phosphate synthase
VSNVLERIVDVTREEVRRRRREVPLSDLESRLGPHREARPFAEALVRPGVSVIAEHKRRSPSAGEIREGATVTEIVQAYERGGAAALSILTEGPHFGGTLADLEEARGAVELPILRKDFVVDGYQVYEAAVAGADAILLIVAAVGEGMLARLHAQALDFGLGVLVEVHDSAELAVAAELGPQVIGINNRDLTTLAVDVGRTYELLPEVPPGTLTVAESGFRTRAELERLSGAGLDAVLVGEALMRAPDIEAACRALSGVGVAADRGR